MRTLKISFALTLLAAVAGAQQPADKIVATNSEIMAMVAKAKADRKPDQPTFAQPLLALAPYGANLEYRAAVGPAAVHKKYAEFFYVVDGSATLTIIDTATARVLNTVRLSGGSWQGHPHRPFYLAPSWRRRSTRVISPSEIFEVFRSGRIVGPRNVGKQNLWIGEKCFTSRWQAARIHDKRLDIIDLTGGTAQHYNRP